MTSKTPWLNPNWSKRIQWLLDSYRHWLGTDLMDRGGSASEQAERLYLAPCVVVSHGIESDPILNSANAIALTLWEMPLEQFLKTPSRLTAEPVHRDERARMLDITRRQGYIDDYRGIRVSATGRRFRIDRAIVWNILDDQNQPAGQAATFSEWEFLPAS